MVLLISEKCIKFTLCFPSNRDMQDGTLLTIVVMLPAVVFISFVIHGIDNIAFSN